MRNDDPIGLKEARELKELTSKARKVPVHPHADPLQQLAYIGLVFVDMLLEKVIEEKSGSVPIKK